MKEDKKVSCDSCGVTEWESELDNHPRWENNEDGIHCNHCKAVYRRHFNAQNAWEVLAAAIEETDRFLLTPTYDQLVREAQVMALVAIAQALEDLRPLAGDRE